MKRFFVFLMVLISFFLSNESIAQKDNRFEEFKEMKKNFILKNTILTVKEEKSFTILFEKYGNKYHDEVWVLKKKLKKEFNQPYDTLWSEKAFKYINDYDYLEQLGMNIKHERNQKLLETIRPEIVLKILINEMEFDQLMLRRIRNRNKKIKEKEKDRK
tara:strand:+ start:246 stop:722 length:477 start_codon:yes stop_codon:yes gene_type:complete